MGGVALFSDPIRSPHDAAAGGVANTTHKVEKAVTERRRENSTMRIEKMENRERRKEKGVLFHCRSGRKDRKT